MEGQERHVRNARNCIILSVTQTVT